MVKILREAQPSSSLSVSEVFRERSELYRSAELPQEPDVVFEEQADVFYSIFEQGDAFDAHAEGEAGVFLAVDADIFEDVGVHHAAAEDLQPAGMLAQVAAFASAKGAGDIHFSRGLGEREE